MMSAYRPGLYVVAGVALLGLLISLPGLLRKRAAEPAREPLAEDLAEELEPAA
jgi:hypothetical protein